MASGKNKWLDERIHEYPKKIVVVAGPSFGTVSSYLLLGATIGAAGVLYLKSRQNPAASTGATPPGAASPATTGSASATANALTERTHALAQRVKSLSALARDTIESAKESLAPKLQEAISEAKSVAANTEQQLQKELEEEKLKAEIEAKEQ